MYLLKKFLGEEFNRINKIIDSYDNVQNNYINLEACCSYPFTSVMEAQSFPIHTIPTEGVTNKRYFPEFECIEEIDKYSNELLLSLFEINNNEYGTTTQPHSGTQSNQIVYNAILENNDIVLSLSPKDGGHISHNLFSSKNIQVINYNLNDELFIDYNQIELLAKKLKPKLIIAGASSYPEKIDFKKIAEIAHNNSGFLLADICHTVLFILGKTFPNPIPYADFISFTMDKTLRGPQGGILLYKTAFEKKINRSIFPLTQGGPLQDIQFSKLIGLFELSNINIGKYANSVIKNSTIIGNYLLTKDIKLINSNFDTHILLIDLLNSHSSGAKMESIFYENNLLVNKNLIPFDIKSPDITSGIRIGTTCITNLNYCEDDVLKLAKIISEILIYQKIEDSSSLDFLIKKYHKNINISN